MSFRCIDGICRKIQADGKGGAVVRLAVKAHGRNSELDVFAKKHQTKRIAAGEAVAVIIKDLTCSRHSQQEAYTAAACSDFVVAADHGRYVPGDILAEPF